MDAFLRMSDICGGVSTHFHENFQKDSDFKESRIFSKKSKKTLTFTSTEILMEVIGSLLEGKFSEITDFKQK